MLLAEQPAILVAIPKGEMKIRCLMLLFPQENLGSTKKHNREIIHIKRLKKFYLRCSLSRKNWLIFYPCDKQKYCNRVKMLVISTFLKEQKDGEQTIFFKLFSSFPPLSNYNVE